MQEKSRVIGELQGQVAQLTTQLDAVEKEKERLSCRLSFVAEREDDLDKHN